MRFRGLVSAAASIVLAGALVLPAFADVDASSAVSAGTSPAQDGSVQASDDGNSSEGGQAETAEPASPYSTAKKGTWKLKSGKKVSYRRSDGSYPTRVTRIGSKVYLFESKGRLSRSKKALRIVDVDGNKHGVAPDGSLVRGWRVKGTDLYYFSGTYLKGKASGKRGDIRFASSGKAVYDLDCAVKVQCMKVLSSKAKAGAGKSAKLKAAWRYVTSKSRWGYSIGYSSFSFLKTRTWAKRYAYEMLVSKKGDCYGFAAVFAALAHEIGYKDVQVVTCRVPGSRDRAADGYTRHGLTRVNGKWYDPEAQYAGWLKGVYGYRSYPMGMKARKARQWTWYEGSGKPRGITGSFNSKAKLTIVRRGAWYYGSDSGRVLTGLRCCKGRLYKFDSKGRMKVSAYKRLQKAARKGRPWSALRKLIGKPSRSGASASCYGEGEDVLYTYDEVIVQTFRPAGEAAEEVMSFSAR